MEEVQPDPSVDQEDIEIIVKKLGEMIGIQVKGTTPLMAARIMIRGADLLLDQTDVPTVEREGTPDMQREMDEIERLMNAGGRGQ